MPSALINLGLFKETAMLKNILGLLAELFRPLSREEEFEAGIIPPRSRYDHRPEVKPSESETARMRRLKEAAEKGEIVLDD